MLFSLIAVYQTASTERRAIVVVLSAAFLLAIADYAGPRIRAALERRRALLAKRAPPENDQLSFL